MQGWASERLPAVYVKTSYFAGTKDSEVLSICTKWCKIKPPHSQLLVVWSQHLVWVHPLVELLRCKVSQFHSLFFQSLFLGQSHLGYLGSFVVANLWVQSCHQHQRTVEMLLNALLVDFNAVNTMLCEAIDGV